MIADSSDEGERGRETGKWSAQDSGMTFKWPKECSWGPPLVLAELKDHWNASGDLIPLPIAPAGSAPVPVGLAEMDWYRQAAPDPVFLPLAWRASASSSLRARNWLSTASQV